MDQLTINPALQDISPAFDSQETAQKALSAVEGAIQSLDFFRTMICAGAMKSDVYTHLSLLEHTLKDLSVLTGYDGMVAKDLEIRHAELRAANLKIKSLSDQLGKGVTADALSAALRRYENLFRAWYEAAGFGYAEIKQSWNGILAEMTDEVKAVPRERADLSGDEAFLEIVRSGAVQFIPQVDGYQMDRGRTSHNLLDTGGNRFLLKDLYRQTFPEAVIHGFQSHKDGERFYLRHTVFVPYTDIQAWYEKLSAADSKAGQEEA